jgi:hypothetical protein
MSVFGIGRYRDYQPVEDFVTISFMNLWFFLTVAIMHCTSHFEFLVGLFILNSIDLYLYGMFRYRSLVTVPKLEDLFAASGDRFMLIRLATVIRFGDYAIVWMAVVSMVAACV